MAYVITSVITKGNVSDPDFDVWYKTILDPNVVYNKFPDLTGQSIESIIQSQPALNLDPTSGFISQDTSTSDDGQSVTTVTTFESQEDFLNRFPSEAGEQMPGNISFSNNSAKITGTNTYFTTNLEIGDHIIAKLKLTGKKPILGQVASIESDTSLTLTANTTMPEKWDETMDQLGLPRDYSPTVPYLRVTASERSLIGEPEPIEFIKNLYNETYPFTVETNFANV